MQKFVVITETSYRKELLDFTTLDEAKDHYNGMKAKNHKLNLYIVEV